VIGRQAHVAIAGSFIQVRAACRAQSLAFLIVDWGEGSLYHECCENSWPYVYGPFGIDRFGVLIFRQLVPGLKIETDDVALDVIFELA
jgi:hypothetical protein